jgi:hypothetical protein
MSKGSSKDSFTQVEEKRIVVDADIVTQEEIEFLQAYEADGRAKKLLRKVRLSEPIELKPPDRTL